MFQDLNYKLTLSDVFSGKMGGAIKKTSALDQAINKVGNRIASAFAVSKIIDFGAAVIDSLKNYEYFSAALKTLLKGDAELAKSLQADLVNLAKTTPFELTQVQDATKQLLAYGFASNEVVDVLRTLGDVSAGIGQPIGEISYLYGTLKTSGRVTLMDLRQFAGRGIPIYETLAKRLHTTTAAINGMVSAGKIGFKDIEGAFKDMTKQGGQFFNLMEDQSKTVGGKISNLGDAWEQLKVHIGQSQRGIIASTVDFVSEFVSELDGLIAHSNKLDEVFKKFNLKGYDSDFNIFSSNRENDYEYTVFGEIEERFKKEKERLGKMNLSQMSSKDYNNLLLNQQAGTENYLNYLEKKVNQNKDKFKLGDINKFFAFASEENKQLLASIRSGRKGASKDIKGSGGGATATGSIGSGTEVSGSRPQNNYITITKLVETLNVYSQNLKEGANKVKSEVAQALLETINDINYMTK